MEKSETANSEKLQSNFIYEAIKCDIAKWRKDSEKKYDEKAEKFVEKTVHTRFPPEPNGYLHIGHAKAICIDFGVAKRFNGLCNLRMDDTNPSKEDEEYVRAIKEDIKWLGFDWEDRFYYASDYFDQMYECAVKLIKKGLAYVCDLTPEQVRKNRGDLTHPAVSPKRDRPIEESLDLFQRMKNGEFPDGSMTLRAKIDLNSGNFNMRDPVIYRICNEEHHRTKNKWHIYPMYDFAHPIEDALEGITHSLCSLEFEDHRPLYEWVIENTECKNRPRQIEFARLGINYTVMSKRKLRKLVEDRIVDGWDDPRMPTLSGLRRRGYTPSSIKKFCEEIGVSKVISTVDYGFLEHCAREELNITAKRAMVVLNPIKLIITNYPDGKTEDIEIENNPNIPEHGSRHVKFSKELYIESDDFEESPPKGYFRMYPGNEVRLKSAYVVRCTGCNKDKNGKITEVYAEYDSETRGGNTPDGRKVKSTIHWVETTSAVDVELRLYDKLFNVPFPENEEGEFTDYINPDSLKILKNCKAEESLKNAEGAYQFMRVGYFVVDERNKSHLNENSVVFNRTVSLKDKFKIK